jgi:hypothetical protein
MWLVNGNGNPENMRVMKRTAAPPGIAIRPTDERVRANLRARGRRGQSLVELAVTLPVLLLIMMGIFTFGTTIHNYMMLTNAVSVGGRVLAVSRGGGPTTDPCNDAVQAVYQMSPHLVQTSFGFTIVLNGNSYGNTCAGAAVSLPMGSNAQLTATYPCNLSIMGINYAPSCSLRAQIAEIVQ